MHNSSLKPDFWDFHMLSSIMMFEFGNFTKLSSWGANWQLDNVDSSDGL